MSQQLKWNGVWPTMITPFNENLDIDYNSLVRLIEWYIDHGVTGLFAVCQSSEMFALSLEERVQLARFVVEQVKGRVPVIASGHIGETLQEQLEEIAAISETGIDSFVLVSNRLAAETEGNEIVLQNLAAILQAFPHVKFGIYECPYPYKRLLSDEVLTWCAKSGQVLFLKDTCCDAAVLSSRLDIVRGTPLRLFNANTTTLLHSLHEGAAGFSGVMANFHPDFYVAITDQHTIISKEQREKLQQYLTFASLVENLTYPICGKYYLQQLGLLDSIATRTRQTKDFNNHMRLVIDQLQLSDERTRQMMV